jgi:hypothetical protein
MPFIPPDPGRLLPILDGLRAQLAALEQLLAEAHDDELAVVVGGLRTAVTQLEQAAKASSASAPS